MTDAIIARLEAWAGRAPDDEMVVGYDVQASRSSGRLEGRRALTVAQAYEQALAVAGGLRARGVHRGDVVALQLPNWPEYVVAHLALIALGVRTVPVSPILRGMDLAKQLELSGAVALLVPGAWGSHSHLDMAEGLLGPDAALREVIVVRGADDVRQPRWEDLLAAGAAHRLDAGTPAAFAPDEPALINFTSGSTGVPKGVVHSLRSVQGHVEPLARRLGLTSADVLLVATTLGHAGGFINGMYLPLRLQARTVLMDRWDAAVALALVERERATYLAAMPTYLADVLDCPDLCERDLASWRVSRVSGGPIARSVLERLREQLPHVEPCPGWGMTEALVLTGCAPTDPWAKRVSTDGRPLDTTQLSVRDATLTTELAVGTPGELVVRSDSTMLGYFNASELTAEAFTVDGWLRTGDQGTIDEDGYLTITGRSKDLIVRGGENIPVIEVEQLVAEHPDVRAACVVGVPDARLGEQVCAVVEAVRDDLTLRDLVDFLRRRELTPQFMPEHLVVLDALDRTESGKPSRPEIRRRALQALGPEAAPRA